MQSVILCAGEGSRAGGRGANKCLTEVPGHGAILDYSLKTALALTNGAIVVVGHGADEVWRHVDAFAEANFPGARRGSVRFAEQTVRDGPCGALLCCEAELGGDDFLLFLGDEIITGPTHAKMIEKWSSCDATGGGAAATSPPVEHRAQDDQYTGRGAYETPAVEQLKADSSVNESRSPTTSSYPDGFSWRMTMIPAEQIYGYLACCGYVRATSVEDVRRTYSLELSGDRVIDSAEKPLNPTNNLMGTGNCLFGNRFLGYVRKYGEELGGPGKPQFSFPDVLKYAIGRGETVMAHEIGEAYLNFNDAGDIAAFLRQSDARGVGPRGNAPSGTWPGGCTAASRRSAAKGVPLVEHQARDE
jgi:dTDP-glucose pyrophosphorylase